MEISNRTMVGLLAATISLVVLALLLTVQMQTPGAVGPVDAFDGHWAVVPQVERTGGSAVEAQGPLVVRLAAGTESATARLTCDRIKSQRPFDRGAVLFPTVPLGSCALLLDGSSVAFSPVFPGDELRCAVDGDATRCTGGLASSRAAVVTVTSDVPAVLSVDDEIVAALPVDSLRMPVGSRTMRVIYANGDYAQWNLTLKPEEVTMVHFPPPRGLDVASLPPLDTSGVPEAPAPVADIKIAAQPAPAPEPVAEPEPEPVDNTIKIHRVPAGANNGTAMAGESPP